MVDKCVAGDPSPGVWFAVEWSAPVLLVSRRWPAFTPVRLPWSVCAAAFRCVAFPCKAASAVSAGSVLSAGIAAAVGVSWWYQAGQGDGDLDIDVDARWQGEVSGA